jgi:hypothetical protein
MPHAADSFLVICLVLVGGRTLDGRFHLAEVGMNLAVAAAVFSEVNTTLQQWLNELNARKVPF